ncbi:phage major capsid protein, partial [Sulfitobacter sp. HI0021]
TVPQTEEDDADRAFGTLQTVPAGSATVIEQDDLVNLMMSLRSPYRMRGNCAWIMNRTTAAIVRKMKDADGRLIWSDSLAAGQPATLLGYPVFESEEMDSVAADSIPIAFGNWGAGYLIADRSNRMRLLRDPFTRPGWVRFYFHHRTSGEVMDSNAIKLLKMAAA